MIGSLIIQKISSKDELQIKKFKLWNFLIKIFQSFILLADSFRLRQIPEPVRFLWLFQIHFQEESILHRFSLASLPNYIDVIAHVPFFQPSVEIRIFL